VEERSGGHRTHRLPGTVGARAPAVRAARLHAGKAIWRSRDRSVVRVVVLAGRRSPSVLSGSELEIACANVWITSEGPKLKPCEVSVEQVLDFVGSLINGHEGAKEGGVDGDREFSR